MSKRLDIFEQIERQSKKNQQSTSLETYYSQQAQWDKKPLFALSIASGLLASLSLTQVLPKESNSAPISYSDRSFQETQISSSSTNVQALRNQPAERVNPAQKLISESKVSDFSQSKSQSHLAQDRHYTQNQQTSLESENQDQSLNTMSQKLATKNNPQTDQVVNVEQYLYPEKSSSSFQITNNSEFIEQLTLLHKYYEQGYTDLYHNLLDKLLLENPDHKSLLPLHAKRLFQSAQYESYHQVMKNLVLKYADKRDIDTYTKFLIDQKNFSQLKEILTHLPEKLRLSKAYQELLAYSCMELGQYPEASSLYRKLTKEDPYQAAYWLGQAKALEALDDRRGAFDSYQHTLNLGPDLPIKKLAVAGVIRLKSYEYSELQQSKNR